MSNITVLNGEIEIKLRVKVDLKPGETLEEKIKNLEGEAIDKMQQAATKIVNEGNGGLICILL